MTGHPDGLGILVKYSRLPVARIKYVPNPDAKLVGAIERGILFQMAFWSVYSITAFSELTEVVAKLDVSSALELVVVDTDGSAALAAVSKFLGGVQGSGEAAWVRNGVIVSTTRCAPNVECFAQNTSSLLAMP